MSTTEQRRLAAIMFTDMVGYSALAQADDQLALELLEEHRRLLRSIFPVHNGVEIKTIGDAFLVEFASALEAAQCAIEIQRALAKRNHDVIPGRRIALRIGIHIGDVVHRDGDVYGDGVNIASRIEPLAGAGGICVSTDVERQVRNALEARFEKLGPTDLKNIKMPMDLFRIVLPWEFGGAKADDHKPSAKRKMPSLAVGMVVVLVVLILVIFVPGLLLSFYFHRAVQTTPTPPVTPSRQEVVAPAAAAQAPDPKSIAVLPFANMSEDKDNAFFADGVHEDILTALGVVRDLKVVSRTSVAQYRTTTKSIRQIAQELNVAYVLEGSVRRAGNKVRVTGQLIKAATDEHVWAKSYDRDLTDIFAIQSALATEIAGALQSALSPQEKSLIERRPTDNLAAYDAYLKAREFSTIGLNLPECEKLLNQAVSLDPKFADAWAELASIHAKFAFADLDGTPERLAKAKEAIETAVRLDPESPQVIEKQGDYYYYGFRDYQKAAEQYQRLTVLRPNDASAYNMLGVMHRRQGFWQQALDEMNHAVQLSPRDPMCLATLEEFVGHGLRRYGEDEQLRKRMVELRPDSILFQANLAFFDFESKGSIKSLKSWLAGVRPKSEDEPAANFFRQGCAILESNYSEAIRIDREQRYYDGFSAPHCVQDQSMAYVLWVSGDTNAARSRAEATIPEFKSQLEKQPANATLWAGLGQVYAMLGNKTEALRCGQRAREFMPETKDTVAGTSVSLSWAQILAWSGEKDQALVEIARLLQTPYGGNPHSIGADPGWLPLHGDPRFEALLNDPMNNAPLPRTSAQ